MKDLFNLKEIDEEGREFLTNRNLSVRVAERLGVTSGDGKIVFPFWKNGLAVRKKWRNMQNKKEMGMDILTDTPKDTFKMPFFNMLYFAQNQSETKKIIVTEGELDCLAIVQLGAFYCVSLPSGASSATSAFRNHFQYLQEFDEIYIAFDMDEAGQKAVEEVKKILPPRKFRRINFPAKDANEWLMNDDPTLQDLEKLMLHAEKIACDEILHGSTIPRLFYDETEMGTSTGWENLDFKIGGMRKGEITVISGDTGCGKTTFALNLINNLLENSTHGVWINSWEMDYKPIIRKFASKLFGSNLKIRRFSDEEKIDFEEWLTTKRFYINIKRSKADIASIKKQIELASTLYDVRYILFDHLDYITASSGQKEMHEKIMEIMLALHEMALEYQVHIILIAHCKQSDDRTGKIHMGMLKGGAGIKQYADNIFLLHKHAQTDPNGVDNRFDIEVCKNRLLGWCGTVQLRYDSANDGYYELLQVVK
jgi:twinkle protein